MENKKKCKACLEEKELSEFGKDKYKKDGYLSKCKLCIKNKAPIEKIEIFPTGVTKVCRACLETKYFCQFGVNSGYKDGLQAKCKSCYKQNLPINELVDLIGDVKICKVCNITKDLSLFPTRNDRKYKYESRCKDCRDNGKYIDKEVFIGDTKKCSVCEKYKTFDSYQKCSSCVNNIMSHCKDCDVIRNKNYRESIPKEISKQRKKDEYNRNKKGYIARAKKWTENNRDRHNESVRIRAKIRMKEEPLYKLRLNISSLIRATFITNLEGIYSKKSETINIIGCDIDKFRQHIESQFLDWMNWENYGRCENSEYKCTWHLDHIIPISIAKTEEELYLLNHWSNFQPLCFLENTKNKRNNVYPLTNLELNITIIEDKIIVKNE